MKAIVCEKYGPPDVLKLKEVPRPNPGENEILIQVRATTVCAADYRVRGLNVPAGFRLLTRLALGFSGPRAGILGTEFAGIVHAVGSRVTRFKTGDQVFGSTGTSFSANAEYICLDQDAAVTHKPENLSFEEAASLPFGAFTALCFLRDKGGIRAGQKVLVYGASGSVGTAAVQLARYFGAHVTGVCGPSNIDLVKSLGAHETIDYTRDDFTARPEKYAMIVETMGKTSISACMNALLPDGVCLLITTGVPGYLRILWNKITFRRRRLVGGVAQDSRRDLELIAELAHAGKLKPVIDRRYSLADTAEAHRYADLGHKKGNLVLIPD